MASQTVGSGDTLGAIARAAGLSLSQLLALNPQFASDPLFSTADQIRPGLVVNTSASTTGSTSYQAADGTIDWAAVEAEARRSGTSTVPPPAGTTTPPTQTTTPDPISTPPGPPTPIPIPPADPATPGDNIRGTDARDMIRGAFPWAVELGMFDTIVGWVVDDGIIDPAVLVGRVRQEPTYRQRFPSIFRQDGTLRFSESEYLRREDSYRDVLTEFGTQGYAYDSPDDFSTFITNEVDPAELRERFQVYDSVSRGSSELRASFWVYAGIPLNDEDLYSYVVDPTAREELDQRYWSNVSASELDYNTYVDRVASLAVSEASKLGPQYQQRVANAPADQVRSLVDQLYTGGNPATGSLGLNELLQSFEAALIGSAALEQGLDLPGLDRIGQFRQAGISRSQALQGYGEFVRDESLINASVTRSSGAGFGQEQFESASFLSDPAQQRRLQQAFSQEKARSRPGSSFGFSQDQGRVQQAGFSAFRN